MILREKQNVLHSVFLGEIMNLSSIMQRVVSLQLDVGDACEERIEYNNGEEAIWHYQ